MVSREQLIQLLPLSTCSGQFPGQLLAAELKLLCQGHRVITCAKKADGLVHMIELGATIPNMPQSFCIWHRLSTA